MSGAMLADIGRKWQEKIAQSPEYTVIENDNVFRLGLQRSSLGESVFSKQHELLTTLCQKHEDEFLEDCIPGEVSENAEGQYYSITTNRSCLFNSVNPGQITDLISRDLTLVRGVGPVTEKILKRRGCQTLNDLYHVKRYHQATSCVLNKINDCPSDIYRFLSARKEASHPLSLLCSSLFPLEKFRFVDIETLGIFGRPIILIGVGFFKEGRFWIIQYLLRDIDEEAAAIFAFCENIPEDAVLVSFNGRSFDIPYIADRLSYYSLPPLPDCVHFDLLHTSRRLWKHEVTDCRLSTLENKYLGTHRTDDLPGALVPEWYAMYMRTGNPGPLIPIVEHNQKDIYSLATLLSLLQQESYERISIS